jgi:acyl phosphate:glycerol-3-phosphate acyltransferase
MNIFLVALVMLLSYLIGSIPFGLIIVRLSTGKDIRKVESGRTGGTNAARAAGTWAGILTAVMDFLKSASTVLLAKALFPIELAPMNSWIHAFAPLAAILGHNYSVFLVHRDETGKLHFRGGAGGAPCVGGSFGLWAPSILFILPVALIILFLIGYASLATMSVAFLSTLIFGYLASANVFPWQYAFYGLLAEVVLIIALRPNIRRLLAGKERLVGLRAKKKKEAV